MQTVRYREQRASWKPSPLHLVFWGYGARDRGAPRLYSPPGGFFGSCVPEVGEQATSGLPYSPSPEQARALVTTTITTGDWPDRVDRPVSGQSRGGRNHVLLCSKWGDTLRDLETQGRWWWFAEGSH